jgi:hypothetical protein
MISDYLQRFQKIKQKKLNKPKNKIKLIVEETDDVGQVEQVGEVGQVEEVGQVGQVDQVEEDIEKSQQKIIQPRKKLKKRLIIESENDVTNDFIILQKEETKKNKQIILKGKGMNLKTNTKTKKNNRA